MSQVTKMKESYYTKDESCHAIQRAMSLTVMSHMNQSHEGVMSH